MSDRLTGWIIADKYRLNEMIGTGGMAYVYHAQRISDGQEFAVKVLKRELAKDPVHVRHFKREAETLSKLEHRNIVSTYGYGEQDGFHYLIMEYVQGITLKEYILQRGRLDAAEAREIVVQVCNALTHAHKNQVIHRDIKPQNIILRQFRKTGISVKVMDFGLAKPLTSDTQTILNGVLGTVQYISPEQAKGKPGTEQSDIYSLGIMLYEMLTGNVPFYGETPVSVALKHIQDIPTPPSMLVSDIAPAMEKIILKAISKNPEERYLSAEELRKDLLRSEKDPKGKFVRSNRTPTEEEVAKPRSGIRKTVLLIVMMAVALGVLVTLFCVGYRIFASNNEEASDVIPVPEVIGLSQESANEILANHDLRSSIQTDEDSELPAGTVCNQYPHPNETVNLHEQVILYVSDGPDACSVPDVLGKSLEEATAIIEKSGLMTAEPIYQSAPDTDPDQVIFQDPVGGAELEAGDSVQLTISR